MAARRRRNAIAWVALGVVVVVGVRTLAAASAASLDLSPAWLQAWSTGVSAVGPAVYTCDNFDGVDGSLAGRAVTSVAACGSFVWTVRSGGWSTVAGSARSDGTAGATATLAAGVGNATVAAMITATIAGADSGGNQAGVALAHDGAGSFLAAVLVGSDPDRIELVHVVDGAPTVLATASIVVAPVARLALVRNGSSVVVRVDDIERVTFGLTVGQVAALGSGSGAGLYASSATITIDDLRITTPTP